MTTDNAEPLRIGNWVNNYESTTYPFKSIIDEVRMWKAYRTATDISSWWDKSLNGDEAGLVAYWKLNDGAGQVIKDFSVNGLNGTLGSNGSATDGNDPIWRPQYAICSNIARKGNNFEVGEENTSAETTFYPNPASGSVNILMMENEEILNVNVLDMQGKQFLQLGAVNNIDASLLPNGFYVVELKTTSKTTRHKLQIIK